MWIGTRKSDPAVGRGHAQKGQAGLKMGQCSVEQHLEDHQREDSLEHLHEILKAFSLKV